MPRRAHVCAASWTRSSPAISGGCRAPLPDRV